MATNVEPETIDTALRICSECCQVKLLTEYRRRYKNRDDRMHQCRACHAAAERRRILRRRVKNTAGRMQAIATAARRSRNMNRLMLMLELGMHASGGVGNLMKDWHTAVRESIEHGNATPRLMGFYEAIFQLASNCPRKPTN